MASPGNHADLIFMGTPKWLREWRIARNIFAFHGRGRIPWSRGYEEHKQKEMRKLLADPGFDPGKIGPHHGLGLDERIVEIPWFLSVLPAGPGRLLDAGSSLNHELYLAQPRLREKNIHICTLAPEPNCFWQQRVSYLFEDLRNLPYRDGSFDYISCISTLEHVGMDNTRHYTDDSRFCEADPGGALQVVREFSRVLAPCGILFLTVPFGRLAHHGWLRIFDGQAIDRLIEAFQPAQAKELIYLYTLAGWMASSRKEAAESVFFDVHAGVPWALGKPASSEAVCCLILHRHA